METLNLQLKLALIQLEKELQSGQLILSYFKVLQHRAESKELKWQIIEIIYLFTRQEKRLRKCLNIFLTHTQVYQCEGIKGIIRNSLNTMRHFETTKEKDAAIIHSLLTILYYKLGTYRLIAENFQAENFEEISEVFQKAVGEVEQIVQELAQPKHTAMKLAHAM